jgi:DnaA N-terminal domain/Helix-turn-helix domain
MSVKAISQVWDIQCPSEINGKEFQPTHKFILVAYADHADHQGKNIYPAVKTIAKKTGYDERTVQRATHALEEMGLLIEDGQGPRGTNKWALGGDSVTGVTFRQGDKDDKSLGDIPSGDIPSGDSAPPELKEQNPDHISIYQHKDSVWETIKDKLKTQIRKAEFETWIETCEAEDFDGQILTIQARNATAGKWVQLHAATQIADIGGLMVKITWPAPEVA